MELEYLKATLEDAQPIFRLCKSLIDAYEDVSAIDYPKVLDWVERKIKKTIGDYTVVTLGGAKVGYFCLARRESKWELDDFYILPAYRGKGIGAAVLRELCNRTDGRIFLYVFRKNTGAIALYERFGFETVKTVSDTRQIMERPG